MKNRLILMLLVLIMLGTLLPQTSLFASAETYSGTCGYNGDNLIWTLNPETDLLTISGSGEMSNWAWPLSNYSIAGCAPWYTYRGWFTTVSLPDGLTSIGKWAFYDCDILTSVTVPDGVTRIGTGAFSHCDRLPSMVIPGSVTNIEIDAFRSCTSLKSVTIGNGVTTIDAGAFEDCTSLISVKIPGSVTSIGAYAFRFCSSLVGINVAGNNPKYSSDAFGVLFNKDQTTLICCPCGYSGAYSIPDSVTSIYHWAFGRCTSLTSVTIPDSVTSIGDYAFSGCTGLTSVMILNPDCTITDTLGVAGTTTIYGYEGSTAQTYAEKYGYIFVPLGQEDDPCANGHTWGSFVGIIQPTCTEPGSQTKTCTVCGATETEIIAALGHNYVDGNCTRCGKSAYSGLSEEIMHLIFADMAYLQFTEKDEGKSVYQYVVKENHGSTDPLYKNSSFSQRDAFKLLGDWIIRDVDYGDARNKDAGYASVVFQKADRFIVAYRGSEHGLWSIFTEDKDWDVDLQFALYNYINPDQFEAALKTYNSTVENLAGNGDSITLTGHSLGGALATYVSTLTGTKAYTYDGADGHVIDLSYYVGFRQVDFHGTEEMNFVNYTDIPSPKNNFSDLIQAMNKEYYYGNYYVFDNDNVILPSGYAAVPAHNIYSTTRPATGGKTIDFTNLQKSISPKRNWKMTFKNGFSFPDYTDPNITRLTSHVTVILGTTNADRLKGKPSELFPPKKLKTMKNVIYGGDGADTLIGSGDSNIIIPGRLEGDYLTGGIGSDLYLLDCKNGGSVFISDQSGLDIIQLKNTDGLTSSGAVYQGKVDGWHRFTIGGVVNVYIKDKGSLHYYRVLDPNGSEICQLSAKDGVVMTGGGGGGRSRDATTPEIISKTVSIDGDVSIRIINDNGSLVETFNSANELVANREYGDVIVTNDEEENHLEATVYGNYLIEISGNGKATISILGADGEYHVDQVTSAEDVDLSKGCTILDLTEQSITQNGKNVETNEFFTSTKVTVSSTHLDLMAGQSAELSAALFRNENVMDGVVCWQTDSPSIVQCVGREDGTCEIKALSAGTGTIYAVAEDSGHYAICTVTIKEINNPFVDVKEGTYYFDAVLWAVNATPQITAGTSATTFSPNKTCTRAEVVTFLWNAAGQPKVGGSVITAVNPFSDVKSTDWYYNAVMWAVKRGVTCGTDATHFSPYKNCSRAEIVTFLRNASTNKEVTTSANPFKDVKASDWYYSSVLWAVERKITSGVDNTHFAPNKTCTRAEVVQFLYMSKQ